MDGVRLHNDRHRITALTTNIGLAIILFAFVGYFGYRMMLITTLIPLIFGIPLFLFGRLSRSEKRHKLWIRFAVFIGILCALTTWAGFADFIESIQMGRMPSLSQFIRTTMFFGCSAYSIIVFVYLWKNRRKRKKKNQSLESEA